MSKNAISPTRTENYPEWYQAVVKAADLAENAPDIRGCMIIKPWGYAIWENIQRYLDNCFKATGHVNAYFPLLIPMSYIAKEADHIDGFAKECAVVTHSRLEAGPDGKLLPAGELEEPYIIRPTSETTIGNAFSRWIQSYRDLPLKINQWANVMRWEMRTRVFLRTSEFLWQEGHTAHATQAEAIQETMQMLDVYADFAQDIAAIPMIKGEKTPEERFPGAVNTYTIEAMMQDKKALQSGTSHFLGTTFSKSFGIQYLDQAGVLQHAQTTSWGLTTRVIGAMIMVHSDDDGMICPPRLAPQHIVIIPIIRNDAQRTEVLTYCENVAASLRDLTYHGEPLRVLLDARDINGAEKSWEYIKKGVPLRLEIGPRDIENDAVFVARRDKPVKEKQSYARGEFVAKATHVLDEIQANIFARAKQFASDNTFRAETLDQFMDYFTPEDAPGFVQCFCHEDADYIDIVKPLKASSRCIPMDATGEGMCIFTGKKTTRQVIFAKAY